MTAFCHVTSTSIFSYGRFRSQYIVPQKLQKAKCLLSLKQHIKRVTQIKPFVHLPGIFCLSETNDAVKLFSAIHD